MTGRTGIEWTQVTWNPVTGCDRISPGCDNCYALTMARRLKAMGQPKYQADGDPRTSGPGFGITTHPNVLGEPLRWREPRLVFVNSMSDLFHVRVPEPFIGSVWDTMALTPRHTYQILTKRPRRMRRILTGWAADGWQWPSHDLHGCGPVTGPLPNAWLGASIEADRYTSRAGQIRQIPAAVRWLSLEPLLEPLPSLDLSGIDWIVIGGESGPDARPAGLAWIRDTIARARTAGTAVFVKQLGTRWSQDQGLRGKGGNPAQWPQDLRIREMPRPGPQG